MRKLKVGDRVRIINSTHPNGSIYFGNSEFIGQIGIINRIIDGVVYPYYIIMEDIEYMQEDKYVIPFHINDLKLINGITFKLI